MPECKGHQRHWFTYRGHPRSSAPSCRRCHAPNPKYVRGRDLYPGGYYCPDCGAAYRELPVGIVTCNRGCGRLGLRGFHGDRPSRIACPVDWCSREIWDDGGVTSAEHQHRYDHATAAAGA